MSPTDIERLFFTSSNIFVANELNYLCLIHISLLNIIVFINYSNKLD